MSQEAAYPINATKKSFEILELLTEFGPLGVTDIAEQTDMSKSSIHNHLSTLREIGYAMKTGPKYVVTYKPLRLMHTTRSRNPVYQTARKHISNLVKTTSEDVVLSIHEENHCVILSASSESQEFSDVLFPGKKLPLHATAPGKAILAQLSDQRDSSLDFNDLPQFTPRTITDAQRLQKHLTNITEDRIGYEKGEYIENIYGVAAPIDTSDYNRYLALAVYGPENRLSGRRLEEDITGQVISAVNAIENDLYSG